MQLLTTPTADRLPRHHADPAATANPFLRHAHYLPDDDRLLLDLFYRRRLTKQDIARLLSQSTGTISRRLNRLTIRLHDPLVLALIESPDAKLSPLHRSIGIQYFLCRTPMSTLVRKHAMSPQQVRQVLAFLQGWHRGSKDR